MKKFFAPLFVAAVIGSTVFTVGCSQEVAHNEKDTPTWTGGRKHEESTTYKNPDGTTTTTHQESKSN